MKWGVDSDSKSIGDFILFPMFGLASTTANIKYLNRFSTDSKLVPLNVAGETGCHSFLSPVYYSTEAGNLDHMFLMFRMYKKMLVTEKFKNAWEGLELTGAVFTEVAEFDDDRFKPV